MTQLLWHTIADSTGSLLGILDEEKDDRWKSRFGFIYQMRNTEDNYVCYPTLQLWPGAAWVNNAGLIQGQDAGNGAPYYIAFEPWSVMNGGTYRPGYIMGQCATSAGTPLVGAVVVLALTSTDQYVSNGTTDGNGNYMLPTPFTGQNHYVYANYASGVAVGASINTLTPNF